MKTFLTIIFCLSLLGCRNIPNGATKAAIQSYQGKPTIHVNGIPKSPMIYALPDVPGGRYAWEELPRHNIINFCEQGIELFQLDISLEQLWAAQSEFDITLAKKQVMAVLEVCPNAKIFFRFHLNPPQWWLNEHPEEWVSYDSVAPKDELSIGLTRFYEADARNPIRASFASKLWKRAALEKLVDFCHRFSKSDAGHALIGIQVAYGIYGEWHQWGLHQYEADFSTPMTTYFQDWLKSKYPEVEDLQESWGTNTMDWDTIQVPGTVERSRVSHGVFRDPVLDRKAIDYYTCQHELVADLIIECCQIIKDSWPRPIITGVFYGYFFSMFNRQAIGGHLALHRVLENSAVDYLSGPQVYYPKDGYQPGEPFRSRSLLHTIRLHGKLWLDEYDQQPKRTWPFLSIQDNKRRYEQIMRENVALLNRNVHYSLLNGNGLWFYDFGLAGMELNRRNQYNSQAGKQGYWDHPIYLGQIKKLKRFADKFLHETYHHPADVLVVYDTESIKYMPSTKENPCPFTEDLINETSLALHYAGVLFDEIHLKDLKLVDLDNYKVVLFVNTFRIDAEDARFIKEEVAQHKRHLIWNYAPGIIRENSIDKAFVEDLIGLRLINRYEVDSQSPLFQVFNQDEHKSSIDNRGNLFVNKSAENTDWFFLVPSYSPEVFRTIFQEAGCQIYTPDNDILRLGGNWLSVHGITEGVRNINLPESILQFKVDTLPFTKLFNLNTVN